jgi:hypothetical protein
MSDKIDSAATSPENEFNMALGWLAAVAVSIASWAGLN